MMKNISDGGEAVLQGFRSLGVDYVMASPGSEWGAVWEALARQKVGNAKGPTYLSCAHETLAVDLAIGYTPGAPGGEYGYCQQGTTYRGTDGEICGGDNWGATDVEVWYPR